MDIILSDTESAWMPPELIDMVFDYRPRYYVDERIPSRDCVQGWTLEYTDLYQLCMQVPNKQDIAAVDTITDILETYEPIDRLPLDHLFSTDYKPLVELAIRIAPICGHKYANAMMKSSSDELVTYALQHYDDADYYEYSGSVISTKWFLQHQRMIGNGESWALNHNPMAIAYTISHLNQFDLSELNFNGADDVVRELIRLNKVSPEDLVYNNCPAAVEYTTTHFDQLSRFAQHIFVSRHHVPQLIKTVGLEYFTVAELCSQEDPEIVEHVMKHATINDIHTDTFQCNPAMYEWLLAHPEHIRIDYFTRNKKSLVLKSHIEQ